MNDPYRFGHHPSEHSKKKRRHRLLGAFFILLLLIATPIAIIIISSQLKPETTLSQAPAVIRQVTYETQTKHYDEDGFGIDLPATWQPVPRPPGPYQTYSWQHSEKGTNGQLIQVYKDTIPVNFALNRVIVIEAQPDRLQLKGEISDNCSEFTKGLTPAAGQVGVPAKWRGVNFLCDQFNQQRDVIGTSSADGVNTINLTNPHTGRTHKFFFTYTNQDVTPDYTVFINALNSFRLQ